jgi:hypothetical protein
VAIREDALDDAERWCELGEGLSVSDDVESTAHVALLRAKVRAARTDLVAAKELARQAVDLYSGTDFLERSADARLTLAQILRAEGHPDADSTALQALALYEQKGNLVGAGWVRAFLE